MKLIDRLEGSYLVQEQEAAEHIRELYEALNLIKFVVETGSKMSIIEIVNSTLGIDNGN